jgi:hypothetical protein
MLNTRTLLLSGIAAVLAVIFVWKWVAGWGYVTVDVRDTPLSKVVKSIERQGGVKISTNADPTTPVTMLVDHVSSYEAVDALAIAIDADTRLAYVAAKDSRQIKDVLAAFAGGNNPGGWVVLSAFGRGGGPQRDGTNPQRDANGPRNQETSARPREQTAQAGEQPRGERRGSGERRGGDQGGGGNFGGPGLMMGDTVIDPRTIVWNPSDMPEKNLQTFFDQGAQKTGAVFAMPEGWNPAIPKVPKAGRTGEVATRLVKSASGKIEEVFLLTVQPPRPQQAASAEEGGQRWEFTRTVFTPQRGGQRNAEWAAERQQAQLAALPAEQQGEVRKQMDEMRAFWESVRNLPEEERRAKIEEMMNRSDVQDKIEERMNTRDTKTPPQKREDRMRNYLKRKNQMKGTSQKS